MTFELDVKAEIQLALQMAGGRGERAVRLEGAWCILGEQKDPVWVQQETGQKSSLAKASLLKRSSH